MLIVTHPRDMELAGGVSGFGERDPVGPAARGVPAGVPRKAAALTQERKGSIEGGLRPEKSGGGGGGGYNVCTAPRVESSLNGCRHGGPRRRVRARRLRYKLSDVECQANASN